MSARVVVVGGGYGGASVARQLDPDFNVTLIEPKDAFVHSSAALRSVVDPAWADRVFYPYDHLLARGTVLRNWARRVSPGAVRVSQFESVDADVIVLATGTSYPFPAKFLEDEAEVAASRLSRLRGDLARTERVMVVGGGPVGLELTGELTAAFPDLHVTVVDKAGDVLTVGDYLPDLREAVKAQLTERGVEFVTGSPLGYLPPGDVGVYHPFTVDTRDHVRIDAQMWFRCFGARPLTDYLDEELAAARRPDGHLRVTDYLTVVGQDRVFAIGDITDVPESKRAAAAIEHADVVVANIREVLAGGKPTRRHLPHLERIVLPLGPHGGAAQLEQTKGVRTVVGADETSRLKGLDLNSAFLTELFGRS